MLTSSLIDSVGLKVTNNFDLSLLIAAGALLVGTVCAKQILPLSVEQILIEILQILSDKVGDDQV